MNTLLIAGFSLGILGSLHCVGMCGPLFISMPFNNLTGGVRLSTGIIFYHTGRISTYTVIGLLFGAAGRSFSFFGWQQILSVLAGVTILLVYYSHFLFSKSMIIKLGALLQPYKFFSRWMYRANGISSFLIAGMINGLLPCGLVYGAAVTAVASGSLLYGSLVMAFFGLGTVPLLTAAVLSGRALNVSVRARIKKLTPIFVSVLAVLLIIRGLGLSIPYISPTVTSEKVVSCHE